MEEKKTDKIMAFDSLFTTNSIQMLKILITYMAPSVQKNIAIYIKFMELQYTITFFKRHPDAYLPGLPHETASGAEKLCNEILPFCDSFQKERINQMRNMYQTFENLQGMMEMLQMMKELFPEGAKASGDNNDFMSGLAGMMSGMPDFSGIDLSQMINLFSSASQPNQSV